MRQTLQIDLTSHGCKLTKFSDDTFRLITDYCRRLVSFKLGSKCIDGVYRTVREKDRVYAVITANKKEIRIHRNLYGEFIEFMQNRGYHKKRFKIKEHKPPVGIKVDFKVREGMKPRDYQERWVKYQTEPGVTKVNTMPTGMGKTSVALFTMAKLGVRTVVTVAPKYTSTWITGIHDFIDGLSASDIIVVHGANELNNIITKGREGTLDAKIIIISVPTLQYMMSDYEENNGKPKNYICGPDELWSALGVGLRLSDEGHEWIHAIYKLDTYTNINKSIFMSGTLDHDDKFINYVYGIVYPISQRLKAETFDKYIEVIAAQYGLYSSAKIKHKGYGGTYSQIKVEQSLLKNKFALSNYLKVIEVLVKEFYINVREPGQKCIVYSALREMCLIVMLHLQEVFPELVVTKFTQEDPESSLYECDISSTTLKGAGTGRDIPGLRTVVMMHAIGSKQQNIQALGRLRKLKLWPATTPTFVYGVCTGIPAQLQYHYKKQREFADKVLSQRTINTGISI